MLPPRRPVLGSAVIFVALLILPPVISAYPDGEIKGQLSSWFSLKIPEPSTPQLGFRYIPSLFLGTGSGSSLRLDCEISLNAYATVLSPSGENVETEGRIKPYRTWVRLSGSQFELRAGLQKINFGAATLFRPLMWFDRVDARDPLQLTEGVYGILFRYYFVNNTRIWIWGLMGNKDPKGWESVPTRKGAPEFGARIELPLASGEFALTYHYRTVDFGDIPVPGIPTENPYVPENRYGFDGKWNVGVGIWLEATLVHQDHEAIPAPYQRTINVGMDYTFGIGNGLTVLAEYFTLSQAAEIFHRGEGLKLTALSLRYPAGLLDNLFSAVYYDIENAELYRFLSWQRTLDRWQLFLMGFWNPLDSSLLEGRQGSPVFRGTGIQIMVVYNH